MRILIVEDDRSMQKLLSKRLLEEGYTVDGCSSGIEALGIACRTDYDCILLDLMIPGMSGLDVLQNLRSNGNKSFILIMTAVGAVENRIKGLDMGADDYLVKPFELDELLARIRALLRRNDVGEGRFLKIADLTVDTIAHAVTRAGKEIELTVKEFALLEYLVRNQGSVVTRTQIYEHVWDYHFFSESNVVNVYIRYLRNKIDKDYETQLIQTVRGIGYVMRAADE